MIIVISAPSASGKTTLVNEAVKLLPIFKLKTSTTRPKRQEETGDEYNFLVDEQFEEIKSKSGFIECAEIFNYHYGLQKSEIENNLDKNCIIILNAQGLRTLKHLYPNNVKSIFIYPPDKDVLTERINQRNVIDINDSIMRLNSIDSEVESSVQYDFTISQDSFENMLTKLVDIITMVTY